MQLRLLLARVRQMFTHLSIPPVPLWQRPFRERRVLRLTLAERAQQSEVVQDMVGSRRRVERPMGIHRWVHLACVFHGRGLVVDSFSQWPIRERRQMP